MSSVLKRAALRFLPDRLLAAAKRRHYYRLLTRTTRMDEPEMDVLRLLARPGDRVLDIGANVGAYTKCLAERVGPRGRVISVEPVPATFAILAYNVRRCGFRNVDLVRCAVSDRTGDVRMHVPSYATGGENFYQAHIVDDAASGGSESFSVPAATVDSIVAAHGGGTVSLIKCDVEGRELSCVQGASGTIERSRPAWLIEVSGDPDAHTSSAAELCRSLAEAGYGIYTYDGRGLRTRRRGETAVNYFFLAETHRGLLRGAGVLV